MMSDKRMLSPPPPPVTSRSLHWAICDGCDAHIYGTRHRCIVCPDFDFCDRCYCLSDGTQQHDSSHSFFCLPAPVAASQREEHMPILRNVLHGVTARATLCATCRCPILLGNSCAYCLTCDECVPRCQTCQDAHGLGGYPHCFLQCPTPFGHQPLPIPPFHIVNPTHCRVAPTPRQVEVGGYPSFDATFFTFRRSVLSDLDALCAIEYGSFDDAMDTDSFETMALSHDANVETFVLAYNTCVIGYVSLRNEPKNHTVYILSFAVIGTVRGRGAGGVMMRATLEVVSRQKKTTLRRKMSLHVDVTNTPAIRLYTSCGFVQTEVRPSYYRSGHDALEMEVLL